MTNRVHPITKPTAKELLALLCADRECGCPASRLASRVEKVLALHQPFVLTGHEDRGQFCAHCSSETRAPWPCPTRRALDGEEP